MAAKHTPGPWRFVENTASTHEVPCIEVNGDGIHQLAYLQAFPDYDLPADECFANARLISAAPDLLAVAQMVVGDYYEETVYRAAVAAIAKATEPQP